MKPHKHADLIHAWADGAEIEYLHEGVWWLTTTPQWHEDTQFRIKPKEKEINAIYGCHIELETGMLPDNCVFEYGGIADCTVAIKLAAKGETQSSCKYWQPIKFTSGVMDDN